MDADILAGVIGRCFPKFDVRTFRVLGEGWDFTALEVNDEYVFRFLKRRDAADNLEKEVRLLPELESRLPVRIPHFDHIWHGGAEYELPFVGYRKIEGVPLGNWCLNSPNMDGLANELGSIITELHSFPMDLIDRLGVIHLDTTQWEDKFRIFHGKICERVFPLLDAEQQSEVSEFWDAYFSNSANFRFTPALLHDDLAGEHIRCDKAKGAVSGIIDWTDASVGDPALDFTGILDDCGVEFTKKVLSAYRGKADADLLKRATFYSKVVPFYEILYGLDFDRPHLDHGLRHLRSKILL